MGKGDFAFKIARDVTPAYEAAVQALIALPPEDRAAAYADATADDNKEDWARNGGLVESAERRLFWGALLGRRTPMPGVASGNDRLPADAHTSLWTKEGKPHVYVSQPYRLRLSELREIVEACDENGLTAEISCWPSWNYPGRALTVTYRRRDG